ncbi:MAG: FAD-dependent oxidoreductase [Candidatus Saccharimonadales bacterium]
MTNIIDTVMIGAGPSALAAAVYTTREDIETVLYEKGVIGGLAAVTDMIDNYPGFPDGIEGMKLADQLQNQAQRFGAKIEFGEISGLSIDKNNIKTIIVDGEPIQAKTVLIATGSDYSKLGIPGEAELYGRGVHYCATCDGAFYREKRLVVVGGGNSAVQEAIFLTRFTTHIDLLVRSTVKASEVLQQDLQRFVDEGKITVHLGVVPTEIVAEDGKVTHVNAKKGDETIRFDTDGAFIFVGLKPNTQFLKDTGVELDAYGLIKTDNHLETNLPGVFASGDVRSGATMQIASAVGEGATAALSIREYLDNLHHVESVPSTLKPVTA